MTFRSNLLGHDQRGGRQDERQCEQDDQAAFRIHMD
jgi:hypothetical protein